MPQTNLGLVDSYKLKGMTVFTAGQWRRDESGKKIPIIANRKDGLDPKKFPNDNCLKYRIEQVVTPDDKQLLVIDADSEVARDKVEQMFPEIKDTFSYRTSQPHKRHYLVYVPLDELPITRVVGGFVDVDLLTNGIAFTSHFHNEATYEKPDFSVPIITLEDSSLLVIKEAMGNRENYKSNSDYKEPYRGREMSQLVAEYVALPKDKTLDEPKYKEFRNKLIKSLTPTALRNKGQRVYLVPKPSHDTLNSIAYTISMNSLITTATVHKFLERFIVNEWGFELNSTATELHYYKSILPTLPTYEVSTIADADKDWEALIKDNKSTNPSNPFILFKTYVGGKLRYVEINRRTLKPKINGDSFYLDQQAVQGRYPNATADDFKEAPELVIKKLPYGAKIAWDEENQMWTLNSFTESQYKLNATANENKPTNVLTKKIHTFFTKSEDDEEGAKHEALYYAWLGHLMFHPKPMNIIMWFSTTDVALAGSGKSILSAGIPSQLIGKGIATTVNKRLAESGWGDTMEYRLTIYEDIVPTRDMTEQMKGIGSNISNKLINKKGGAIVQIDTSPCQSGSSNAHPDLDPSDRRFFVCSPKRQLSEAEADELYLIFEENSTEAHKELQEIADYALHIYKEHRLTYRTALFTRAYMTDEKRAIIKDTTIGKRLNTLILEGVSSIKDQLGDEIYGMNKGNYQLLIRQLAFFLSNKGNRTVPQETYRLFYSLFGKEATSNAQIKKVTGLIMDDQMTASVGEEAKEKFPASHIGHRGHKFSIIDKDVLNGYIQLAKEFEKPTQGDT
ncbi:MAG: hypothetical protein DRN14_04490 [Thermoplasmata archaeon]|nr:MAG: hypothetical protein DRN14_04490 [Thermoplasmata archaeon]